MEDKIIKCNLYKDTGKWYGGFTIVSKFKDLPNEKILEEAKKHYSFPENFIIHILCSDEFTRLILPKSNEK